VPASSFIPLYSHFFVSAFYAHVGVNTCILFFLTGGAEAPTDKLYYLKQKGAKITELKVASCLIQAFGRMIASLIGQSRSPS
jgi:hypothetical protein